MKISSLNDATAPWAKRLGRMQQELHADSVWDDAV
jgi:hypothetical protein